MDIKQFYYSIFKDYVNIEEESRSHVYTCISGTAHDYYELFKTNFFSLILSCLKNSMV